MSPSEQEPTAPTDHPAHERSTRRRHFGRWLPLTAIALVLVALLAALLLRTSAATADHLTGSVVASTQWQSYTDPYDLYTLQLPPGWVATVSTSITSYGDKTGSATVNAEMLNFSKPSQGMGSAYFYTVAYPVTTAFDHQYYCQPTPRIKGFSPLTLNGMEHTGAVSIFSTGNAVFQLDIKIPGVVAPAMFGEPLNPPPTPTALPATWTATDKAEVNEMLVSFQPTDPNPLAC